MRWGMKRHWNQRKVFSKNKGGFEPPLFKSLLFFTIPYHFMSAARNAGMKATEGEWFLYLDDDEWFDNPKEIVAFFLSGNRQQWFFTRFISHLHTSFIIIHKSADHKLFSKNKGGFEPPLFKSLRMTAMQWMPLKESKRLSRKCPLRDLTWVLFRTD